jgi:hypothetical protein
VLLLVQQLYDVAKNYRDAPLTAPPATAPELVIGSNQSPPVEIGAPRTRAAAARLG